MKRFMNYLSLAAAVMLLATACKKDENRVVLEGGTNPVLSANRTTSIPLSAADSSSEAVTLTWTNPNYRLNTGVNSLGVTYQLEIDTANGNFSSDRKQVISISNDLSKRFTQAEINGLLTNGLRLAYNRTYNIQMRVIATVSGSTRLVSNVLSFSATTYAPPPKVNPYTNEVFIVGNATPGGWNNPVPDPAQKLTQLSPTMYTITLQMVQGNSYLFLPQNGSWSRKYGFNGGNNSNTSDEGEFVREGGDIKVNGVSGLYKVDLDFQTGTFKLTKQ